MTPDAPWQVLAGPAGRWLLARLPGFMLRRYYNTEALERHLKMRPLAESGVTLKCAKELVAPSLEIEGEVFNMSPYLDVEVTAVRSFLSYTAEDQADVFAAHDDWCGFNLPRGSSRPFQLTYWLNQFQMAVVQSCLDRRISICVYVSLYASSRVGIVRPCKNFYVSNPTLK